MSRVKVTQPIEHPPTFVEYRTDANTLVAKLHSLGLSLPLGTLDYHYYYTTLAGWGKVLYDLTFNSRLYKADRFDCDNYALRAMNECARRYGLNTLGFVIGQTPQGRHAFNLLYFGSAVKVYEPNAGYSWAGIPFDIGENGYLPELLII